MNSPPSTREFAALVAIDGANPKHRWALQAAEAQRVEGGELENTPEAVEQWAAALAQRFGGRPVAVALEQTRGALVALLSKYAHLVLYPVHPGTRHRPIAGAAAVSPRPPAAAGTGYGGNPDLAVPGGGPAPGGG